MNVILRELLFNMLTVFSMVNTRTNNVELQSKPYVLPSQCEHVFYSEVPGKVGWSFVVRHNPRGRSMKYNLKEGNEEGLEEEYDDKDHDKHALDDHDDPQEYVKELVELDDVQDQAHEDDINDDMMIITNLYDDDDMVNPYNVDSGYDDTNDDLDDESDEEYDEVY